MQRLMNWRSLRKKKYAASEIDYPSVNGLVFDLGVLSEGFFGTGNRVNCAAWIDSGQTIIYGTDSGVFVHKLDESQHPARFMSLKKVSHIGVFEELRLIIVRSKRTVFTFSLERARSLDREGFEQSRKKLDSHVSFLTLGECLGRRMLCIVKAEKLSSTLILYHASSDRDDFRSGSQRGSQRGSQSGSQRGSQELAIPPKLTAGKLKIFKEFYISTKCDSVTLLKTQLCLGCASNFEIVDLKTSETHGLLDPKDSSLKFVRRQEDLRALVIYRIGEGFLLCYTHFALYVNKSGRLMTRKPIITWDGVSTSFTLEYPYLIVFKRRYVEIYNVERGTLGQVIRGDNFRPLFEETLPNFWPVDPSIERKQSVLASDDQVLTLHHALIREDLTPDSESDIVT
ncbi:CNH-domain-containing protein [Ceratobasidium sp. AG-I]|nr:CNH-domain-containing protein [Ceratobasidium sp. AG-I]